MSGRAVARSAIPSSQTGVKGTTVPLRGAGQGSLGGFQGPLTFPLRAAAGGKRAFATALGCQGTSLVRNVQMLYHIQGAMHRPLYMIFPSGKDYR